MRTLWVAASASRGWVVGEGDREIATFTDRKDAMLFRASPAMLKALKLVAPEGVGGSVYDTAARRAALDAIILAQQE